jgi:hypothetical protein
MGWVIVQITCQPRYQFWWRAKGELTWWSQSFPSSSTMFDEWYSHRGAFFASSLIESSSFCHFVARFGGYVMWNNPMRHLACALKLLRHDFFFFFFFFMSLERTEICTIYSPSVCISRREKSKFQVPFDSQKVTYHWVNYILTKIRRFVRNGWGRVGVARGKFTEFQGLILAQTCNAPRIQSIACTVHRCLTGPRRRFADLCRRAQGDRRLKWRRRIAPRALSPVSGIWFRTVDPHRFVLRKLKRRLNVSRLQSGVFRMKLHVSAVMS